MDVQSCHFDALAKNVMNKSWITLLTAAVFFVGCANREAAVSNDNNPMPRIWAGIGAGITELENAHAPEDAWAKEATGADPRPIRSLAELMEETKELNLTPRDRAGLPDDFSNSSRVVHFGFDCDFHALVFFDDSKRAWKVIKW